jgi:hypothetical protein
MAVLRVRLFVQSLLICCLMFADAAQAQSAFNDYTMPPSGQVAIPAEGGLTFQMRVNGQGPFATVFDTGAVNVISTHFVMQLGLKIAEKPIDFGAIGGAVKAHTTHIDTLTIGDLNVRDQTFYVVDIPSGVGIPQMLVGWEFLQRFAVRMDFQRSELTFYDLRHFTYKGSGAAVPLILNKHGNGIYLDAKVDGIKGRFQLDSGNETGLFLNAAFVDKHHLPVSLHATLRGYNGKGLGGDSPEAWFTRLQTLDLGGVVLRDPVVRLQIAKDDYLQKLAGNIGQSTLKHFTAIVDCRHHVMYLEKRSDWDAREPFNRAGILYDGQDGVDEVKTVFPGSPADLAGIRSGDLITAINGIRPTGDANDPAFTQSVGTVLHLTVRRESVEHTYDVTLREML